MYQPEHVAHMATELTNAGFKGLHNAKDVVTAMKEEGTTFVVVNSVCGCAAGSARPGAILAIKNSIKPDHLFTVFAGVDIEAVNEARKYMLPYPSSSPSMAVFKDGKLVHFLERHHIEGNDAQSISNNLVDAFNAYCVS